MKLQLKVFSGSWWATENRKQTQKPKGQPEGIYTILQEQQSVLTHSHNCCRVVESDGFNQSAEKLGFIGFACELQNLQHYEKQM